MLELAVVPAAAPWVVRRMAAVGRRVHRGYLRASRRRRGFEPSSVEAWKIVHAAERLAEGIVEESPLLVRFVERARESGGRGVRGER